MDKIEKSLYLTQREHKEVFSQDDPRTNFVHDRDRIIHSKAFRRLMHKTQIFNANKGDHFRNRLTHTLEVAQIARSIGRRMNLNEDLIEAIALGHDLGHTPFGHIGERKLGELMHEGLKGVFDGSQFSFKHNFQSVRVVEYIENKCDDFPGINLTLAVREGMIKHTKLQTKDSNGVKYDVEYEKSALNTTSFRMDLPLSITLEGQVVAIADEIAQLTHDIEDGIRGNIISFDNFASCELVKNYLNTAQHSNDINPNCAPLSYNQRSQIIKGLVGYLISDVAKASESKLEAYEKKHGIPSFDSELSVYEENCVGFSEKVKLQADDLAKKRDNWIIFSKEISQADSKAEYFITQIFKAYYKHPKELPDYILARYYGEKDADGFDRTIISVEELQRDPKFIRFICDHIAGMSDQFAAREYMNLYIPNYH